MRKSLQTHFLQLLWLLLLSAACLLITKLAVHISFDSSQLVNAWQLLDLPLLKNHLLKSIWYLHSQPPLFNLLVGIVIKLFPQNISNVFEFIFIVIGLIQSFLLYFSIFFVSNRKWVAFLLAAYFNISPSFLLYQNWLFYTFPAMCAISSSLFLLIIFLRTKKKLWAHLFFIVLSMLALTVTMFHLIWLIAVLILCCVMLKKQVRTFITAAFIPVLIVTGWYTKNLILFKHFTASTWSGMNISKVMISTHGECFPDANDTIRHLVSAGPFKCIDVYEPYVPADARYKDVEVLHQLYKDSDVCNFNNIEFIYVSDKFREAAISELKYKPHLYLRNLVTSNMLYFAPASYYFFLDDNRKKLGSYDTAFNVGLVPVFKSHIMLNNLLLILLYVVIFTNIFFIIGRHYKQNAINNHNWQWQDVAVSFAAFNILFFLLIGNLAEVDENMRFRFQIIPLFLFMIAYVFTYAKAENKKV